MLAYMNDASNPQNAYPAFWAPFSRLSPKVQRNNFLLLSSPLTTAIGTTRKCLRGRIISAYWGDAGPAQTSPLTDRCQFDMLAG